MIILNDTVIVEETIHQEWLQWLYDTHIPAVMATGCFESFQVLTVIDSPNEGATYCVQYHTPSLEYFNKFYSNHFHKLQAVQNELFENKFVLFNTLMETVERA